jgi:competence protein ComEA
MKSWQGVLLGIFLGLAASAIILLVAAPPRGEPLILPAPPTPSLVIVQVSGAVLNPGLVSLPRQSRVQNAIDAAGGFSADADRDSLNLAARVNDGDKITVFSISMRSTQAAAAATGTSQDSKGKIILTTPTPDFPVNINTASIQELQNLPNIGLTKAEAIVNYRQQHGSFKKVEDIQNVAGIGASTFEKIKEFITVGNS